MVNEWIYCFLIRVYPLSPYPALHCGGILCGIGIHPQILLTILATGVVIVNPSFEYLILVMHQKLVINTTGKGKTCTCRTQNVMMTSLSLLMIFNIAGFGFFGRLCAKPDEILSRPELAWLAAKGGEVFSLRGCGRSGKFRVW
ncbi:hypothetical protein PENTCL1PPCAC_15455 [Pristionchus entomophagus]|uniref:G protein-coupled receptor n=1 Tax=Pristionchus entomophagus TaxID=358040 RepID=A0AAV5TDK5_9BILA|nr:hypothetical protein PENTCL1PPCAC_15455 [Pristionchus entomophagus]